MQIAPRRQHSLVRPAAEAAGYGCQARLRGLHRAIPDSFLKNHSWSPLQKGLTAKDTKRTKGKNHEAHRLCVPLGPSWLWLQLFAVKSLIGRAISLRPTTLAPVKRLALASTGSANADHEMMVSYPLIFLRGAAAG